VKFPFMGREQELSLLDQLWEAPGAQFLVLYGRRRIGKTALLSHWIERTGHHALYWVAAPSSPLSQLRSFSQAVYNAANPDAPAPDDFTYASWEQAWRQVANLSKTERVAVFIDEFTYILGVSPEIAGTLQNLWDQVLSKSNLLLCISGSHLGMMKREFLSYQAPLYGRATAQIHLPPIPFGQTHSFFPKYSAVDRVAVYAIFGGIPAYWERVDLEKSVSANIKTQLLSPNNLMQSEPALLLHDFVSDLHNYSAILNAIANNARTPKEIATLTGLPSSHIPKYLSVLVEASFVERRVSVIENPSASRNGRYHITDPYLRFYFRFLESRQYQFSLKIQDQALAEITRHMIDFIGTHTWEELCREWVLRAGAVGNLPFMSDQVGSAWNRAAQIDVVGLNRMEKTMILGECKWTLDEVERKVMAELVEEKAAKIIPEQGQWRVYFLGFSRSGWTQGAQAYQEEINRHPLLGTNWISAGMRLLTLEKVDVDLRAWSV
jgi:AAA+ ATPase superfamily predicted ATPase